MCKVSTSGADGVFKLCHVCGVVAVQGGKQTGADATASVVGLAGRMRFYAQVRTSSQVLNDTALQACNLAQVRHDFISQVGRETSYFIIDSNGQA